MSDMHVDYNGTEYDSGHADVDLNGNGHDETSLIYSDHQVEYYTDNDGDGSADELTITDYNGDLVSHEQVGSDGTFHETSVDDSLGADAIGRDTSNVEAEGSYYPSRGSVVDGSSESDYGTASPGADTTTDPNQPAAQYNDGSVNAGGYTDQWAQDQAGNG